MNGNFKDQPGAPAESASAPAVTASEDSNHHREQTNTASRKLTQQSAHLNGNKRTAPLNELTLHHILTDLKAGLAEHSIAESNGVPESRVRDVRKLHLSLEERVRAILHIAANDIRERTRERLHIAADDIRELGWDSWKEGAA
jgi:hypothetical protein